jgi:hypothetical protein
MLWARADQDITAVFAVLGHSNGTSIKGSDVKSIQHFIKI